MPYLYPGVIRVARSPPKDRMSYSLLGQNVRREENHLTCSSTNTIQVLLSQELRVSAGLGQS